MFFNFSQMCICPVCECDENHIFYNLYRTMADLEELFGIMKDRVQTFINGDIFSTLEWDANIWSAVVALPIGCYLMYRQIQDANNRTSYVNLADLSSLPIDHAIRLFHFVCGAKTKGGITEAVILLKKYPSLVNSVVDENSGYTPLLRACLSYSYDSRVIDCLLSIGADPNILSSQGESALHLCVYKQSKNHKHFDTDILDTLVRAGCSVKLDSTKDGNTLLHIAAKEGHVELVKWLLENGANPNATNNSSVKPYQVAKCYKKSRKAAGKILNRYNEVIRILSP